MNEFQDSNADDFDEIGFRDQSKQRLLDNSERLERTGKQLNEGYKMVIETEEIANQTLRDLSEQRDTITRARSRVSRRFNPKSQRKRISKPPLFYSYGTLMLISIDPIDWPIQ